MLSIEYQTHLNTPKRKPFHSSFMRHNEYRLVSFKHPTMSQGIEHYPLNRYNYFILSLAFNSFVSIIIKINQFLRVTSVYYPFHSSHDHNLDSTLIPKLHKLSTHVPVLGLFTKTQVPLFFTRVRSICVQSFIKSFTLDRVLPRTDQP